MIRSTKTSAPRKGVVLLAVLVVVVLLTLAAYQYSELMTAEYHAADSHARAIQSRSAAESGVHYAAAILSNADAMNSLNGLPYDNAATFQDIAVGTEDDDKRQMHVSLLALRDPDDPSYSSQPYRFGVLDESGKINVNALLSLDSTGDAGLAMLMLLPNMTEDIANAILDYIDTDDTPRSNGAENDYYSTLSPPYQAKNGPLDSLEELLLVKGVTPQLLFGNDRNRNGVLDPGEDDGSGQVDPGWSAYLTVYSRDPNLDNQGNPRIYLNDADLDSLSDNLNTALGPDLAQFIIAYRLYGSSSGSGGSGGSGGGAGGGAGAGGGGIASMSSNGTARVTTTAGAGGGTSTATPSTATASPSPQLSGADKDAVGSQVSSDRANRSGKKLSNVSSVYDLLTAKVSVTIGTGQSARTVSYPSPLSDVSQQATLLPKLLDSTTTSLNGELPPKININTAPRIVLATLPGLSTTDVQTIIDQRPQFNSTSAPDAVYQTPAWLLTQAHLSASALKSLEKYITARTQVYRIQALGYSMNGGPTARIEAVVDTNAGRPRVIYWRDLGDLGKGFDIVPSSSK